MPISIKKVRASKGYNVFPEVALEGSTLVVKAGAIQFQGRDLTLLDDEVYTLTSRPVSTGVVGYLVEVQGSVRVFVDELVGSKDLPYKFRKGQEPKLLHRLFYTTVPPNTTSALELAVQVVHVGVFPEEDNG
jgi:hypothetical protein